MRAPHKARCSMAMNRVQFQRGLSMPEFMDRYGSQDKCEAAVMASRWPGGFVCPECGGPARTSNMQVDIWPKCSTASTADTTCAPSCRAWCALQFPRQCSPRPGFGVLSFIANQVKGSPLRHLVDYFSLVQTGMWTGDQVQVQAARAVCWCVHIDGTLGRSRQLPSTTRRPRDARHLRHLAEGHQDLRLGPPRYAAKEPL